MMYWQPFTWKSFLALCAFILLIVLLSLAHLLADRKKP